MAYDHNYTFGRKMNLPKNQADNNARRNELYMASYYDVMEKDPPKNCTQAKHKPYQCDIELI